MRSTPPAPRTDDGFTLIELMVVVLIISVLMGIAIPTFFGARASAQDGQAQSHARNSLAAAKTLFADTGDYSSVAAGIAAVEPSLDFVAGSTDGAAADGTDLPTEVGYFVAADAETVTFVVRSDTGDCFYLRDSLTGTTYAVVPDAGGACANDGSQVVSGSSW